ncbi:von Willebrand factor A domain-containing 7-like protein [Labeo rohita]|uniref:von Willebrand factor A domain-containing 7-like protein n=1 Tax=Labeo rohita TaxID=84645 RepID=A0A498NNP1_LABRO|nr:von Willebrand factor A domain-containing 7-like protein [Labeo rohita]
MRGAFLLLALMIGVQTFHTREKSNSKNHQDITKLAILRATAEVCKSAEGFTEPEPLNAQTLAKACKKDAFKRKCSHGGTFDFSTGIGRGWDGINKDAIDSSHGLDHHKAADMAVTASVQLLDKIWKNNDDPSFFRLMGLDMTKPKGKWKTFFGSK